MRTYTVKSPHKMQIGTAMATAGELVRLLEISPDILPLIPQTLSDRPRKMWGVDWQSIGVYTPMEYVLVIHIYSNIQTQNVDFKLPLLETVDLPNE
jgi:hypothetical protein